MKIRTIVALVTLALVPAAAAAQGTRAVSVADVGQLTKAIAAAKPGDVIEMSDGTWADAHLIFNATGTAGNPVTLRAQTPGRVNLTGTSYLKINGPHLIVDGLHFVRTAPLHSTEPVIEFRSEHGKLLNTAIENYNPPDFNTRYHWVRFSGPHNVVEHCSFTGKNHQGPVIALADRARYNAVRYSHFENIPHAPQNGREIIQASAYGDNEELGTDGGFMAIEHNLFERADGEGAEIISLKSNRNVVRFNTFRATIGGIVGRSGNFNTIEGNIILGEKRPGTAGIRVSGQGHVVRNNYIAEVAEPALNLYAGEYFVDDDGKVAKLTEKFAPIMRANTQYGAVPAYGHVKDGVFESNIFVNNAGPDILVGGLYKSGWPARQRVLMPEGNRIAGNRVFASRDASTAIQIVTPETDPPLDRFSFKPNTIENNPVTAGPAPAPPTKPLSRRDVGPKWSMVDGR
jgi:poly(beta-D-mannuronate) lyase